MKHTPGPWHVDNNSDVLDQNSVAIAHLCAVRRPETEANARLIAAAPQLMEALEDALGLLVKIGERTPIYESDGQIYRAEAAIRKAKGD